MKPEYKKILDELITNEEVIDSIDGGNILPYLRSYKVITPDEHSHLMKMGPSECMRHLVGTVLKTRSDSDMIIFLKSLEDAKFKEAFDWLQKRLERCQPETRDALQESVARQLASGTAMSDIDKRNILCQIFEKNSAITPDLYIGPLVRGGVLTYEDKEHIESKITYIDQQIELVKRLAIKDMNTLKKIKDIARSMKHNDFANDLESARF